MVTRCLSVRPSRPRHLLPRRHCTWQGTVRNSAAGPGQPDLAEPRHLDQRAGSPSGRASPSPSGQSLPLIKGINWHAACLFGAAVASAVPGSNESHTEPFSSRGPGAERGASRHVSGEGRMLALRAARRGGDTGASAGLGLHPALPAPPSPPGSAQRPAEGTGCAWAVISRRFPTRSLFACVPSPGRDVSGAALRGPSPAAWLLLLPPAMGTLTLAPATAAQSFSGAPP